MFRSIGRGAEPRLQAFRGSTPIDVTDASGSLSRSSYTSQRLLTTSDPPDLQRKAIVTGQ
jgi:hypothetical protein